MNLGIEFFFYDIFFGGGGGRGSATRVDKRNWVFRILESFMNDLIITGLH